MRQLLAWTSFSRRSFVSGRATRTIHTASSFFRSRCFLRGRSDRLSPLRPPSRQPPASPWSRVASAVFLAGLLGAELFLTRIPFIGVVAGSVWSMFGSRHLRLLAFPVLLLFLMVPLPTIVFNQIAFPLQLFASRVGETVLTAAGVPVVRGKAYVLELASCEVLEVAQACSGIRSRISLLTLGVLLGKLTEPRIAIRVLLAILTVPVAIAANAARVVGTGLAANWIGPEAAEGFFHTFSGWLVFVAASPLPLLAQRVLSRLTGGTLAPGQGQPVEAYAVRAGRLATLIIAVGVYGARAAGSERPVARQTLGALPTQVGAWRGCWRHGDRRRVARRSGRGTTT